jgi:hypothetical protein
MRTWVLAAILAAASCACAADVAPVVLFDFESGIEGWTGNPWGGGKCGPSLAEPGKFGKGALKATYTDIKQGGNVISPYFADDAAWRNGDYDTICLWLKGDGSGSYLSLILESGDRDKPDTFTGRIPLDSKQWHRVCLKFDTLWNRQGSAFDLKTFQRLYFGVTGTHEVLIDQIALQQPLRRVPLDPVDNGGPAAMTPVLYADREGTHYLTFDPQAVLEPTVTAEITVTWPQKKPIALLKTFAAQAAKEELWLTLPGSPEAEGDGELKLRLAEEAGNLCYTGGFQFPVALPVMPQEPTQLQFTPRPKQVIYHPGSFDLRQPLQAHVLSQEELVTPVARRLQTDLKQWLGVEVELAPVKPYKNDVAFLGITPEFVPPRIPQEVQERLPELREQGYVLHVDGQGIILAAKDADGLRNGLITLLQAARTASPSAAEAQISQLTITDWPTCQWRAVNIGLPTTRWGYPNDAPVPVDYFIDYLRRTVVDQKINMVGLEIAQGMKYDRHPEIAGPAAYSKDEVRRIVRFLRDNGIEVFPIIETLGHANWLVIPHPELRDDGDEDTLCTRNPQTRKILVDCFEETVEVFDPRLFHFGLDEIRWVTANVATEKRCKLCKGVDKRELFVEHVCWLQSWATTSDLQMTMWADMLIPEHNGGAPFNLADTVDRLPYDIVMCDWSTSLAPLSLWELQRKGFPVLKSNSCGVNPAQTAFVIGNMWGIWAKTPWLTESCWRIGSYAYPRQISAAEYSWNPYPDLLADEVPCLPEYFQERPLAQKRLAQRPEPAGGKTVTSLSPSGPVLTVAGVKVQPFAEPVTADNTKEINSPASALYLLIGADLAEADRSKFLEAFKNGTQWHGVPIGEFEITLADGTKAVQPILYGTHVRSVTREEPLPQVLEALGQEWVGNRMGYLVQWVNPHPETAVISIRFIPAAELAKPVWLGAAARSVREADRPAE